MTIRLLQLSDCHLQEDPEHQYRGINPEENLQRCLAAALAWEPDALLFSGDLVDQACKASYQRLNHYIGNLDIPTLAFPGNHDDPDLMQRFLTAENITQSNHWVLNDWQIVWLDSNIRQQPHGELSAEKLLPLQQMDSTKAAILALHHQPVSVGTPWIDRFKLTNPELLWNELAQVEHTIKAITWGHIHHGWQSRKVINDQAISLYGAPSTSACARPGCEEFELDIRGPRLRWMLLDKNGQHSSGLLSV